MTRTLNKANRLKELEKLLVLKPYGVRELAELFGVTRRTIERDLNDLRETTSVLQEGPRYSIQGSSSALNDVEALAVHSATRLLVHTGVGESHYRSALRKLARQLPGPARTALAVAVDSLATGRNDRTLDLVAQAWFGRRVLRCEYRPASSESRYPHEYEIYFYELNRRNLQPYVIARERLYFRKVGAFRLSRMHEVRLLDETYEIPADFDPLEYLDGAWGMTVEGDPVEVILRVQPSVAAWFLEQQVVDRSLEVLERREDGSLQVCLKGRLAKGGEAHEILSFILGWGSTVEVIAPASVRDRVVQESAATARMYRGEEGS